MLLLCLFIRKLNFIRDLILVGKIFLVGLALVLPLSLVHVLLLLVGIRMYEVRPHFNDHMIGSTHDGAQIFEDRSILL